MTIITKTNRQRRIRNVVFFTILFIIMTLIVSFVDEFWKIFV